MRILLFLLFFLTSCITDIEEASENLSFVIYSWGPFVIFIFIYNKIGKKVFDWWDWPYTIVTGFMAYGTIIASLGYIIENFDWILDETISTILGLIMYLFIFGLFGGNSSSNKGSNGGRYIKDGYDEGE